MPNAKGHSLLNLEIMKEAYCSEKVSEMLKKKGFDEPCMAFWEYELYEYSLYIAGDPMSNSDLEKELVDGWSATTHQMACAWVREKGYHIYTFRGVDYWVFEIQSLNEDWTYSLGALKEHDEAIEAALKYSLENLI